MYHTVKYVLEIEQVEGTTLLGAPGLLWHEHLRVMLRISLRRARNVRRWLVFGVQGIQCVNGLRGRRRTS